MGVELVFDGRFVRSEASFHDVVEEAARSAGFVGYGRNLDALWDVLIEILPRPISICWSNSSASREAIGTRFDDLLEVLREAERELGSECRVIAEP